MDNQWSLDERYSRQILFEGIGREGQRRLQEGSVVILGCGALGCAQAEMLARAGVGRIRLIDRDIVESTNLHRQVLFEERDAEERLPKAVAAAARLEKVNRSVCVEPFVRDANPTNIESLLDGALVILDGTDNFETRYLLNDAAVKLGRPWIYGAAVGAHGLQMTIRPGITRCRHASVISSSCSSARRSDCTGAFSSSISGITGPHGCASIGSARRPTAQPATITGTTISMSSVANS